MARKKFKTVAGYLRSMADSLYLGQEKAKLAGKPALSDEDGQRQIINNLLLQLGIKDQVGFGEKPLVAVERMRKAAENDKLAKDLDTCLRWLARPEGRYVKFVGAAVTRVGVTYAGERFTEEEFAAIEKLASVRAITLEEAVKAFRAEHDGAAP
jgi:hypothetical protein